MMIPCRILFALAVVLIAPNLNASNIVANGDFSSGSANWTSTQWGFGSGAADTGCVGTHCITGPNPAYLYQNLSTKVGDTYTLSFEAEVPLAGSELQALFGGTNVEDLININTSSYVEYTITGLVASSSTTELEFLGRDDIGYVDVTDVSVVDTSSVSAAPEPGTMCMVGTGLLSLFGVARRKLRSSTTTQTL